MAYLLGKYIFLLLRPSNLLLVMGLLGLAGLALRRPWGVRLLAGAWLGLALVTLMPLGAWLSLPLEERFPQPPADAPCPGGVDGAVVLGGGVSAAVTRARGQPSFHDNMERVAAIPELARRFPAATILYTGGVGWTEEPGALSEAAVVAQFLARQGLPEGRVLLEQRARSTRENALLALPLARPAPGSCWLLVTSAMHMPRSIGVFRQAGWPEMTPMAVDYRTTGEVALDGLAIVSDRLGQLDQAAYEWYGLLYYWLLGYTDAPFPGPAG